MLGELGDFIRLLLGVFFQSLAVFPHHGGTGKFVERGKLDRYVREDGHDLFDFVLVVRGQHDFKRLEIGGGRHRAMFPRVLR